MNEVLKLKSISELLNESFFIPSYQRGYRWTKQQVEDLLEDIMEFSKKAHFDKKEGFYCLQPIVIKKSKSPTYMWDVIDGQQRLTTIYILLKYFEQTTNTKPYEIGYETRLTSEEFLATKLSTVDDSNIDFFHMSMAYETIKNWFNDKDFSSKNLFLMYLLQTPEIDDDNIDKASNIRVIWYEVQDDENKNIRHDIEIFTRINMGKIPLTNAELVKALLLEGFEQKEQFEIASEWDQIEYSLQNDDLWLFINKEKKEQPTRIEFIFELISENYLKQQSDEFKKSLNKSIDTFYIFHIINHLLHNDSREKDEKKQETIYTYLWKQVKTYYRILNEWYEDRELFHKIGFLVIYSSNTILDFVEHYIKPNSTKDEFRMFLNQEIQQQFSDIEIESLKYEDNDKAKRKIRKVLLMLNLQTLIDNKNSNMRFQFDRFKNEDWDIEHIRSQTDKYPVKQDEKLKWLLDISIDENFSEDEIKELTKNENNDQFVEYYNTVQKNYEGVEGDFSNKDRIGNLALLDATTNRGYGNAFFPIKRRTILLNDMNGTFIPICTKNVFMKYYTENVGNPNSWNETDALEYEKKIKQILKQYLTEKVESNEQ